MSFARVKASSWNVGDKFLSSQANQLDIDHALSLDKSTAGDQISGFVSFAQGTGMWGAGVGGLASNISTANALYMTWQGPNTPGTPTLVVGVTYGIDVIQNSGIISTIANGIVAKTAGAITTTVAGGISDGLAGGITISQQRGLAVIPGPGLNGIYIQSSNSWIEYQILRGTTLCIPLAVAALGTGWTINTGSGHLTGPATTAIQFVWLTRLLDGQFNGSTLTSAKLFFAVGQAHANAPAVLPAINIIRAKIAGSAGGGISTASLYSGGAQSPAGPGSGAAWYSSGNVQELDTVPNQNNVIDMSQYQYLVTIIDENGANSLTGDLYFSLILGFTGVTNSGIG